jgi:hypothetical protein
MISIPIDFLLEKQRKSPSDFQDQTWHWTALMTSHQRMAAG